MNIIVSTLTPAFHLQAAAADLSQIAKSPTPPQIDIDNNGTELLLNWPEISGATNIALDGASISFYPPTGMTAGLNLGDLKGLHSGEKCKIAIPGGPRPVRSLYLSSLRLNDGSDTLLPDKSALTNAGRRLAVAVELDGVIAPVSLAVRGIGGKPSNGPPYTTPPLLQGASYSNYRLNLPDVMANALHLMLVQNDDPEDFDPVSFAFDNASGYASPSPQDLILFDADDAPFYAGAGPITAPITIDATNAVQRALEAAINDAEKPSVRLVATSRTPGQVGSFGISAAGEVQRVFDNKIAVTLTGTETLTTIPGAPLDAQHPSSATCDLVIIHDGVRLHEISDELPKATGGLTGPVVSTDTAVWHPLPPMAMRGEVLRRVGIIGYALQPATLSLRVLGAGPNGAVIAPPNLMQADMDVTIAAPKSAKSPQVIWFDLGNGIPVDQAIGFEVSAVTGRFLWVDANGGPLVQMAVSHELTGDETVMIGSSAFTLIGARTTLNGTTLKPADFTSPPLIASDHFVDVTLSRLTLGYAP